MALFLSCAKPESHEVEHVFYIGLDGWGSYSVEQSDMQNVKKMMAEGAWTLKKRTVLPSHSATNWDAMFTGVGPEQHGFWECCSEKPDLEPAVKNAEGIFPTVFTYLREKEPKAEIGCLYEWSGIKYLIDTVAFSYHAKVAQAELCEAGRQYILEKKPVFFTFYIGETDSAGHKYGWESDGYYESLAQADKAVGAILQAARDAGIYDDTIFVFSSDHGGIDKGHGGITMAEMRTPLIIWGKGVKKGWCFDDVPTVQQDVASVLADLLGVKLPDYCRGRSIGGIFE